MTTTQKAFFVTAETKWVANRSNYYFEVLAVCLEKLVDCEVFDSRDECYLHVAPAVGLDVDDLVDMEILVRGANFYSTENHQWVTIEGVSPEEFISEYEQ